MAVDVKSAAHADIAEITEIREKGDISSSVTESSQPRFDGTKTGKAHLIQLNGYIFFATLPSLEKAFKVIKKSLGSNDSIVLDVSRVYRFETAAVEFLERGYQELDSSCQLIFVGIAEDSAVHADFRRGGLPLDFTPRRRPNISEGITKADPIAFESLEQALRWCNFRSTSSAPGTLSVVPFMPDRSEDAESGPLMNSEGEAVEAFIQLFPAREILRSLSKIDKNSSTSEQIPFLDALKSAGARVRSYQPGQSIKVRGEESIDASMKQFFGKGDSVARLGQEPGDKFTVPTLGQMDHIEIMYGQPCWTVEIPKEQLAKSSWLADAGQWQPSAVFGSKGAT
ncbi:MAG: hypothetical protein Q9216_002476 [Gyalolechia sp. 2 TL-2023]